MEHSILSGIPPLNPLPKAQETPWRRRQKDCKEGLRKDAGMMEKTKKARPSQHDHGSYEFKEPGAAHTGNEWLHGEENNQNISYKTSK